VIAAGNIGCLTQLGDGAMPAIHTVELLDWMAGGPEPEGIAKARELA
jgi:glycolate oxidase iron-sulfur subunit